MRASPVLLAAFLTGCELLGLPEGNVLGSPEDRSITVVNAAEYPFAVIAFAEEMMPLIDPRPALGTEEFEQQQIPLQGVRGLVNISGYEEGDDVVLLLYSRDAAGVAQIEHYGGAPLVQSVLVTAEELRRHKYRVVISDL